jgi:hypothetical protein
MSIEHEDTGYVQYMPREDYKVYMSEVAKKAIEKYSKDFGEKFNEWYKAEGWAPEPDCITLIRNGEVKSLVELLIDFSQHYKATT